MRIRTLGIAAVIGIASVVGLASPASAGGCSGDGPVPVLYKKVTGDELIHCP